MFYPGGHLDLFFSLGLIESTNPASIHQYGYTIDAGQEDSVIVLK